MIAFYLAFMIYGTEAERPPSIVSPHQTQEECFRARRELDKQIEAQGGKGTVYSACLKVQISPEA